MKLLILEDEQDLTESIVNYIGSTGFTFDTAARLSNALEKINLYEYDCAIIDLMLPDGNGLDAVTLLRKVQPKCGIIILTAKNSLDDKIIGLDIGADDYMTKPFHLAELNSRVKSVMRRNTFGGNNEIAFNELIINIDNRTVSVNNYQIELTKREFDILLFLISNKERVLTKEAITEHIWGDDSNAFDNLDFVYTHIKNLRKKLTDAGAADYIKSVYGVGYKFTER